MKKVGHTFARNLTDSVDGFLRDMQFLVIDYDVLFTKQFCSILGDAGVDVTRTAIQAPDINAIAESWVQTVKRECLSKLITPTSNEPPHGNRVDVDERLGGLLRNYRHSA